MATRTTYPLIAGALGLALLTACGSITIQVGDEGIDGSGNVVTETIDVGDFTAIEVQNSFEADITVGEELSVVVEADNNLIDKLDIDVNDGELRVRLDGGFSLRNGTLKAIIQVPSLDGVDLSGASDVSIEGVSTTKFTIEASGASNLTVSGSATELEADVSGASSVVSELSDVSTANVDLSGASNLELQSANTVTGDASGASTLTIPEDADASIDSSGASSIERS